ncbi:Rpn family recombination-promoting nuclease/putative transposase [Salisediminibacterium selenitireducens]|uniref:Transposase (putative) YhgA-like domain-containing protein n=1 Tax=Bacillus selenitireducens (strain ATCC 700615 / DSM 15326 / MLS10) TaxID=439292 RepID=D6Y052_BACIE|nr:Rpn family recombination-promoting nuclease/putative transposase [Salisediminibacterium selenitireducens]ADH98443.1 hypothetical protein Bsel_0921 [[Bacillus] selenitireducens MLS10]
MADYARHDIMFKEAFGDPVLASALLEEVLPDSLLTRIVPDSLTPKKDTFITEDRGNPRTLIIPILIAQDRRRWSRSTTLMADFFSHYSQSLRDDCEPFTPNFRYLLYDIQEQDAADMIRHTLLKITIELMALVFEEDEAKLEARMTELLTMSEIGEISDSYAEQVLRLLEYIMRGNRHFDEAMFESIRQNVTTEDHEGSEMIMNFAEQLEQRGIKKGLEQGMEKGMEKGQHQRDLAFFLKLTRRGESKEAIVDLLDLDDASFEALQAEVNENGDIR